MSEVVDFLSFYWRLLGRTARRDFRWALVVLQLGLVTYDLIYFITHMATTFKLRCLRWRCQFSVHRNRCVAQVLEPLVSRILDADLKKAQPNGCCFCVGITRSHTTVPSLAH